MSTRRLIAVTTLVVAVVIGLLLYVVADAIAYDTPRIVRSTSASTSTTWWNEQGVPSLPDSFKKLVTPKPKRVRQQRAAMPRLGGAAYPTDELLAALARCETGGTMNPATNTGNGYYGAFQFTLGTWHSIGGTGYPHEHPYVVQRDLARALILRSGWGQFPSCSRAIGAR